MIINIQCDKSTSLKSITYHKDIEKNIGDVFAVFKNNEEYFYKEVNISDFVPLIHNQFVSVGAAFYNNIRNKYTGQKITNNKEKNNENINE